MSNEVLSALMTFQIIDRFCAALTVLTASCVIWAWSNPDLAIVLLCGITASGVWLVLWKTIRSDVANAKKGD